VDSLLSFLLCTFISIAFSVFHLFLLPSRLSLTYSRKDVLPPLRIDKPWLFPALLVLFPNVPTPTHNTSKLAKRSFSEYPQAIRVPPVFLGTAVFLNPTDSHSPLVARKGLPPPSDFFPSFPFSRATIFFLFWQLFYPRQGYGVFPFY